MSFGADLQIGFLGAGNMAEAIARGVLSGGIAQPDQIWLSDVRRDRLEELSTELGVAIAESNEDILKNCDIVILAVKPQVFPAILPDLAYLARPDQLFVSILAGLHADRIEAALEHPGCPAPRVVRAMPNTPALIGEGVTALCPGRHAHPSDLLTARGVFDAVGETAVVEPSMMDGITGLTGSGPAYIFLVIEALLDAADAQGLPAADSARLVKQMVLGAARLAKESDLDPAELRRRVTSPGGTTQAGLEELGRRGFREALVAAVDAAARRSAELAKG